MIAKGMGNSPVGPGAGKHPGAHFTREKVRPNNGKKTLLRLIRRLGSHKIALVTVIFSVLLGTLFTLAGPWLLGRIIDTAFSPDGEKERLPLLLGALALSYGLSSLLIWFRRYVMIGLSQRMLARLREDMFAHMQNLPLSFFDSRPHGDTMSRFTNDLDNLGSTMSDSVIQLISSVLTLGGTVVVILLLNVPLALITLLVIPVMLLLTRFIGKRTRKAFRMKQKEMGRMNGMIQESLNGQKEIIAYGREEERSACFSRMNEELRQSAEKAQFQGSLMGPLMNFLSNAGYALVAFSGTLMALGGHVSVGTIASFLNYVRQFNRPLNQAAQLYNSVQAALAGAERIFALLDEAPDTPDAPEAEDLEQVRGLVEFDRVDFSYVKGRPILKKVSLKAEPGETIALVGPTGAGKTTVVNLLNRFYPVEAGTIRIDGKDIAGEIKRRSLRKQLGVVLQDTFLFSATVKENIRYGRPDATDREVEEAARTANANHFIHSLPDGYDTVLTGEGGNLSQGQRQLLSIARAVLADPQILILDEATSNVDTCTEKHIQDAMLKLMKGRTCFVIAHRLSTIREADKILVMKDGEVAERGRHGELIERNGIYARLYRTQYEEGKAI
ncbi:MAG: ABC transporter ATP-binding protein [Spirochaetales bacterium]|nr:ABC transporter ATP-binding protein [Spirochaetales bacterium]